jgi:hypothetical protein
MGDKVVNGQEEDLGELEELMIHLESGDIAYAVLSFGGFIYVGDKLFAIPWQAFTVDAGEERLILDIDDDSLEDALGFDKDDWPATPGSDYIAQVCEYYGYEPY